MCGSNVFWSYDENTKTLSLTGNGKVRSRTMLLNGKELVLGEKFHQLAHTHPQAEFFADLCGYLSRGFARELDKRKDHKGDVSLKLRTRLL